MYFCQKKEEIPETGKSDYENILNESEDDDDTLGTSGLINLGNTCYMNSIIQCLSNTDDFRSYMLSEDFINLVTSNTDYNFIQHSENINNYLSFQIRRIFSNIWNSSFYSFRPITFRKLFGNKIDKFQNSGQQDSQEALMCILDTISEELNSDIFVTPINKNLNYDLLENLFKNEDNNQNKILEIIKRNVDDYLNFKSIYDYKGSHKKISEINNIFEGRSISLLECSETNGLKAKFDSFFYLTLSVPSDNKSIESDDSSTDEDDDDEDDDEEETKVKEGNEEEEEEEEENKDDEENEESDNEDQESDIEIEEVSDENKDEENDIDIDKLSSLCENDNEEESESKSESESESESEESEDDKYNIYNLLDEFIKSEQLTDHNKWFSPYANDYVNANKYTYIWESPKILIILLKRFEFSYTGGASKINTLIDFPINDLDISKFIHPSSKSKFRKYDLFAINNHTNFSSMGFNGITFGHYYSYCKNHLDNEWYNYDDETVTKIEKNKLITKNAYMLFYQAKN